MPSTKRNLLKIMQWNSRSAVANKDSLIQYLLEQDIDIALLSETWFKPGQNYHFKGYNIVRTDRHDGKAGVAILIKKQLIFKDIPMSNNFNQEILVCGAQVSFGETKLKFLSVYKPPDVNSISTDWNNIFSGYSHSTVIGGDFNAHSKSWGSHKDDNTSNQLLQIFDDLNLVHLNDGSPTRLTSPGMQPSAVDLSICTTDIAFNTSWTIISDTLGSDHFPILILITLITLIITTATRQSIQ